MLFLMRSQKGKHKMLIRIYAVGYRQNSIGIVDCEARSVQSSVESLNEKQMWLWFYTLHVIWAACAHVDPELNGTSCMGRLSCTGEKWLCGRTSIPLISSSVKPSSLTHSRYPPLLLLPRKVNSTRLLIQNR